MADGYLFGVPLGYFQPHRLMSYWLIKQAGKDKDPGFLRHYVTTGLVDDYNITDKLGDPFQPRFDPRRP